MTILTDSEIEELLNANFGFANPMIAARAFEAAVLAKLRKGQEPVGYIDKPALARMHTKCTTLWPGTNEIDAVPLYAHPSADAQDAALWRAYKARKDAVIAAGMGRNPLRGDSGAATKESQDVWLRVIDEQLVSSHLDVANKTDGYDVAKEKLNKLIVWYLEADKAIGPQAQNAARYEWLRDSASGRGVEICFHGSTPCQSQRVHMQGLDEAIDKAMAEQAPTQGAVP